MTRDRESGSVAPEPVDGSPVVDYVPSAYDRKHIARGMAGLAKLCYLQGARELMPIVPGIESFKCPLKGTPRSATDAPFAEWLRQLETSEIGPRGAMFQSAHQMGSCRMSATPESGVVDPTGKVWEADNLYVADASVFPSASGVNPMVTVMATADHIAWEVAKSL